MKPNNEALDTLRAAAVAFVNADKQQQAAAPGETFACRITTYKAINVRVTEFTLYGTNWDAIKAHTYFALSRSQIYAFEVAIWTNDLERLLLRIDAEKVGYDNAVKQLAEFLSKH